MDFDDLIGESEPTGQHSLIQKKNWNNIKSSHLGHDDPHLSDDLFNDADDLWPGPKKRPSPPAKKGNAPKPKTGIVLPRDDDDEWGDTSAPLKSVNVSNTHSARKSNRSRQQEEDNELDDLLDNIAGPPAKKQPQSKQNQSSLVSGAKNDPDDEWGAIDTKSAGRKPGTSYANRSKDADDLVDDLLDEYAPPKKEEKKRPVTSGANNNNSSAWQERNDDLDGLEDDTGRSGSFLRNSNDPH